MHEKTTNLFIHGTNSSVLAQLIHTEFTLFSPLWMIEKYQIAPLGGELTLGGLDTVNAESRLAFGRLVGRHYSLKDVQRYAFRAVLSNKEQMITLAQEKVKSGVGTLFSNINLMLIYIARLKQIGIDNSEWIAQEELDNLYQQTQATLQFLYLILLLGSKINPDYELLDKLDPITKKDTIDSIHTHLTAENILKKITESKIDIKAIYENPNVSISELERVAHLLKLPKTSTVRSKYNSLNSRNVVLDETIIFKITHPRNGNSHFGYTATSLGYRMLQNAGDCRIEFFLADLLEQNASTDFFKRLHDYVLEESLALQKRLPILESLLSKKSVDIFSNTIFQSFIDDPFPIIFICDEETKLSLHNPSSMEYRTEEPLKLGKDILMIATDSLEHQKLIRTYLADHKLDTVSVITFDKLACFERQEQIHSIFKQLRQEDSYLIRMMKRYHLEVNDLKEKLNNYEAALVAELAFLPAQDEHPLRAARALAALNAATNHTELLNKLGLFTKEVTGAKFYRSTQLASSELNALIEDLVATAVITDLYALIVHVALIAGLKQVLDIGFSQQRSVAPLPRLMKVSQATVSRFFRPEVIPPQECIEGLDDRAEKTKAL